MFDDFGRGTNLAGAQAITYAADRGAQVINMSWGTGRRSGAIQMAIDYAAATGAVLVASAGNAGGQVLDNFPAAYDAVISVGATTSIDALAEFSNHGVRVDLVAPGVNILSTQHGGYFSLSGTSQAAAYVTGVAAHLRYRHPELPAEEVRSILRQSAADLGRKGWDPFFGAGRMDAARALSDPRAPTAEIRTPRTLTATAAPTIDLTAAVEPPQGETGAVEYVLEVGTTADPATFEPWATGTGRGVFQFPPLPLPNRPEGDLTLRLRVRDAIGREAEDRVLFRIDRRPPVLVEREVVNRLAGPRLDQWLRYLANEPVVGRVYLRASGTTEVPVMLGSLEAASDHTADLSSLLPGRYDYWIDIQDLAGFESRSAGPQEMPFGREILPVIDVPASGFRLRERLPGFELGAVADLDGDGRPEVLAEKIGAGEGWVVLESPARGGPLVVRSAGGPGLPLAARDVDGDGAPEVLIASSGLTLYQGLLGPAPQVVWSDPLGDRRAGGQLTDADGDGRVEVLFSTLAAGRLTMVEWNGSGFDPVALEMTRPTRTAGYAIGDHDRDGRPEIVCGSLSGELVALESTPKGWVEVLREPFLDGLANAITAVAIGDGDGDGRAEVAISAVGALLDRGERPSIAILEAPADNRFEVIEHYEFRDKNTPYDNALAAGDVDGDGVPEVLVAQAGDLYLLAADRNDRYLPIWRVPRAPGGRAVIADLDGDGRSEILFSERIGGAPVTSIYSFEPVVGAPPAIAWQPVLHPLGNEVQWQSPGVGFRIFDLALYRALDSPGRSAPAVLESDLGHQRIFEQRGEVTAGGAFREAGEPPGERRYFLAYTADDGKSRLRVLDGPRTASGAPGVPTLLVLDPFPNPTPGAVEIGLALARPGQVSVRIVDLAGRVRRRLVAAELPAGRYPVQWDGRDDEGHRLARGIYFVAVSGLGVESAARVALVGGGGVP
jgi:hypothetical protein